MEFSLKRAQQLAFPGLSPSSWLCRASGLGHPDTAALPFLTAGLAPTRSLYAAHCLVAETRAAQPRRASPCLARSGLPPA